MLNIRVEDWLLMEVQNAFRNAQQLGKGGGFLTSSEMLVSSRSHLELGIMETYTAELEKYKF